jgi:hypothetical protein
MKWTAPGATPSQYRSGDEQEMLEGWWRSAGSGLGKDLASRAEIRHIWITSSPVGTEPMPAPNGGYFSTGRELGRIQSVT